VRYRAFVFVVAAPQQFVAGNALDGMPGSRFCWYGFVCMQQRQLKKFLRPFEGVLGSVRLAFASFLDGEDRRTNMAGQTDKRRKNHS
jgi:hypothetical protein